MWHPQKFQWGKNGSRKTNEIPQGTWLRGARKVTSGFVTQSLWLVNGKVGSQAIGKDRSRLPEEEELKKLREETDEEEKTATEQRKKYTDLGLELRDRDEQVACHTSVLDLAMRDEACQEAEMLTSDLHHFHELKPKPFSFLYRFFHFSRPPDLRLTFDAAKRNGKFGRIQCQRNKEDNSTKKRKLFLYRRTVRVEVKSKVIPMNFLKIEERGTFVGVKDRRERDSQCNW